MQVWLKHDLRLDDHPGFTQASEQASAIIPAFCMDPRLYVHLQRTPNGIEGEQLCYKPSMLCCQIFGNVFRFLSPCLKFSDKAVHTNAEQAVYMRCTRLDVMRGVKPMHKATVGALQDC